MTHSLSFLPGSGPQMPKSRMVLPDLRLTRTTLCLGPGPHPQLGKMLPALLHP